jgi:methionyl-tRNA formyltransferase
MINDHIENIAFTFFGSSRLSVIVLNELKKLGFLPSLIVTTPDKPQGRKLVMTPNVVKTWAIEHNIKVLDPAKLDKDFIASLKDISTKEALELFIVASYGKILPNEIIEMPKHKTLNIHPSLLPRYRGPSPLPTAMLDDSKSTGVSIMRLDAEMDHGPIIARKDVLILRWPTYEEFEEMMAIVGAHLLADILPDWVAGKITPEEQNHAQATYTKKIDKKDAELSLSKEELKDLSIIPTKKAYDMFRKIQAYHQWPQAYFFIERAGASDAGSAPKKIRVKITDAAFAGDDGAGKLAINKVIPEGKNEMSYESFVQGYLA